VPLLLVAIGVAVLGQLFQPAVPPKSVDGVAQLLANAVGGTVHSDEFVWEPSSGPWTDFFFGRAVIFLAAPFAGGPRDLYRGWVRVSREGRAIAVRATRNLTATASSDEGQLVSSRQVVAFTATDKGAVVSVTALQLDAQPSSRGTENWLRRLFAGVDNWLQTGSTGGIRRTELVFHRPSGKAELVLQPEHLLVTLQAPPSTVVVGLGDASLRTTTGNPSVAAAWTVPSRQVTTAGLGADLAEHTLGSSVRTRGAASWQRIRSWLNRLSDRSNQSRERGPQLNSAAVQSSTLWPPRPVVASPESLGADEGQWRALQTAWLPPALGTTDRPDPYLVETTIHSDPQEPFVEITLVAIDTRQVGLRFAAGYDQPRPDSGARANGRIGELSSKPQRARIIAAFNGGMSSRGLSSAGLSYGLMVARRVSNPPRAGAATVALDAYGSTWMGPWPKFDDDAATSKLLPDIVSFRQSAELLLDRDAPIGRPRVLDPESQRDPRLLLERSALCLTRHGFLIYAYSRAASVGAVTEALRRVECNYAVALAASPQAVGFALLGPSQQPPRAQRIAPHMSIRPHRFLEASGDDFFYLALHDPRPRTALALSWQPDEGQQPSPAWLPAIYRAETARLGATVRLTAVTAGRLAWQLRPGYRERAALTATGPLSPEEQARAMIAIGLGVAFRKDNQRGLVLDGAVTLPIRSDLGVLTTALGTGALDIGIAPENLAPHGDATELVLLAVGGRLRSEARVMGPLRLRSAACLLGDGTLLVAQSTFDSGQANTTVLVEAGCQRVVELNRGKQVGAFIHRAGTDTPPREGYDDTTLYGLSQPARGTARLLRRGVSE